MNRFLAVLIAAGALSVAPLGFADTHNNDETNQGNASLGEKLDDLSKKHTDVNLKTGDGKVLKATMPHEHASDLSQGDKLEVMDEPEKKKDDDKGWF